jgi:hypothetical protein
MAGHELLRLKLSPIRLSGRIALCILYMVILSCMLGNGCCWPLFKGVAWLAANLKARSPLSTLTQVKSFKYLGPTNTTDGMRSSQEQSCTRQNSLSLK